MRTDIVIGEKGEKMTMGKWISTSSGDHFKCSECGTRAPFWYEEENSCEWNLDMAEWLSDFCPNCGADMRERKEE